MLWKLPPKEKIYEAFSVIADERYTIISDGKAFVTSSSGDKKYSVTWEMHGGIIRIKSNDNASVWQGYTGYPIIATLMALGRIRYDEGIIFHFRDIPWKSLNAAHKNNYAAAVNEVLTRLNDPALVKRIRESVDEVFKQIEALQPER